VTNPDELSDAICGISDIYICADLKAYITRIVEATRTRAHVTLGVSPRGALALMKASKGYAAIRGRKFVLPDDIKEVAHSVLDHRLLLESVVRIRENAAGQIIEGILETIPVPTEAVFEGE
jgi:MoxR-like ATPase